MKETKIIFKGSKKDLLKALEYNQFCIEYNCNEFCSLSSTDIKEHFESYFQYKKDMKDFAGVEI